MPTGSSIISTDRLDDSFAGASGTDFTKRWLHARFNDPGHTLPGVGGLHLEWEIRIRVVYVPHEIRFHADQTGEPRRVSRNLIDRVWCQVLVDRIPDGGIPELLESIGSIYEFYSTRSEEPALLPTHQQTAARRGRTYTRPEFHFDEE